MNREKAYTLIGYYEAYQYNKEYTDNILDVLEQASRPMTTKEITQCVNAHNNPYVCESTIKRILNNLYANGYPHGVVNKAVVQDTTPIIIKDSVYKGDVRIDKNGNYVFINRMVLPDGTTIKGDLSSYFSTLEVPSCCSWVEIPMKIYVKRNYWSLK